MNGIGNTTAWMDKNIVDGMVNLSGLLTLQISLLIKKIQSGKIQQYLLYFLIGVLCLLAVVLYKN